MTNAVTDANQPAPEAVNQRASVLMKRGISLLNESTPASLRKAVDYFERAIRLRRSLPLDANSMYRYGLAAGWMNRGDALTRLASTEDLQEAVRSYDAALEVLRPLPLDENPLFRRRQAIAWQNRGLALQAQRRKSLTCAAKQSFENAIASLENAGGIADCTELLSVAWMNYANTLAGEKTIPAARQARTAAKQALSFVLSAEKESMAVSETTLKARHILCQSIATLLSEKKLPPSERRELLAEATDAVDEGMALARHWETRGVRRLQPLAQDLFCFGAQAYQAYQPHFLGEFLLENLDPSQSPGAFADNTRMHAAALKSLWRVFREIQGCGLKRLGTAEFESFLEKLRGLSMIEERLTKLRERYLTAKCD